MKLPLAVALALGSVNALALGLGPIQIKSGLNQPLVAEIAVSGGADETAGLAVALASAEDFARVGLSRSRLTTPLEFSVVPGGKGTVIRVTSSEPVKDPFLDFLLEVNWAKGKLLREYTVLLDPPVMAPAKGAAKPAVVKEAAPAAKPVETAPSKPAKPSKAPPAEAAPSTAAATPSAPPPVAKAPRTAQSGEYGPVNSGEALYDIAGATRPDDSVTVNQMMLALLRANPNAFYQNNINSLKRGAILRIPSNEEIKAAASAAAAAAEVKSQVEAWRAGSTVAKPTVVADTGAKPAPAATTKPAAPTAATATPAKPGDKLALVPPKAGSGSQAGTDKAGSSTGSSTSDVAAKAELARAKEALASREQEAGELKSRVKELEDLKTKNDRLLSLKDSELAELQKKLKELQDKSAAKPATTTAAPTAATATPTTATPPPSTNTAPATTTATPAKPADKAGLTKEDIWGTAATTEPAKPATTSTTASSTTAPATTATSGASTPSTSTATAPATSTTSTTTATPPATTGSPSSSTAPSTSTTAPASTTAAPATPSTATSTPAEPPKPATSSTTTPAKPSTPAKVQPLPPPAPEEPWYKQTWLLAVAGAGLLGLVLLGLLNFLRRPKAAKVAAAGAEPPMLDGMQDEEHDLLDRLAMHPDDTSTHLELVSLYYARQDAEKFEDAAQAMYAHLGDTDSAEWEQIKAMGRELAPHNPLFSDHGHDHHAAHDHFGSHPTPTHHQPALDDDVFADVPSMAPPPPKPTTPPPSSRPAAPAPAPVEDAFDFDLTDHSVAAAPPPPKPAPVEDFTLNMPAMDFDKELAAAAARVEAPRPAPAAPAPAPVAPRMDDDFAIAGDDATGTKLDLAKAYLDMGDPEGARSMLEEVLTEGNANQKAEAGRLLKEIR